MAVAFRGADVPVDDVCATLDGETRWKHEHLGERVFSTAGIVGICGLKLFF